MKIKPPKNIVPRDLLKDFVKVSDGKRIRPKVFFEWWLCQEGVKLNSEVKCIDIYLRRISRYFSSRIRFDAGHLPEHLKKLSVVLDMDEEALLVGTCILLRYGVRNNGIFLFDKEKDFLYVVGICWYIGLDALSDHQINCSTLLMYFCVKFDRLQEDEMHILSELGYNIHFSAMDCEAMHEICSPEMMSLLSYSLSFPTSSHQLSPNLLNQNMSLDSSSMQSSSNGNNFFYQEYPKSFLPILPSQAPLSSDPPSAPISKLQAQIAIQNQGNTQSYQQQPNNINMNRQQLGFNNTPLTIINVQKLNRKFRDKDKEHDKRKERDFDGEKVHTKRKGKSFQQNFSSFQSSTIKLDILAQSSPQHSPSSDSASLASSPQTASSVTSASTLASFPPIESMQHLTAQQIARMQAEAFAIANVNILGKDFGIDNEQDKLRMKELGLIKDIGEMGNSNELLIKFFTSSSHTNSTDAMSVSQSLIRNIQNDGKSIPITQPYQSILLSTRQPLGQSNTQTNRDGTNQQPSKSSSSQSSSTQSDSSAIQTPAEHPTSNIKEDRKQT